jgi:hypothetical protein
MEKKGDSYYIKTRKFKMPLYKKAGITLINVNAKYELIFFIKKYIYFFFLL